MSESEPSTSQAGNTDDLLAQLAGEEVDRLLADADVTQTPAQEVTDHVDDHEAAALTSMLEDSAQKELDEIDQGQAAKQEANSSETPEVNSGAQEDVSSQLDQLFAALTTSKKERDPDPPPGPSLAPTPPEIENTAVATEEKTALQEPALQPDDPLPPNENTLVWWARPLEWINIPFASLSPQTKEKLGWIGVQTIIFALLILAYVWWLRGKK